MDTNPNVNIKTTVTNKKLHLTIGEGKVTTNKIADDAITSNKITDGAVINAKLADNAVSTECIEDSSITTAKIVDGAVTDAKLSQTLQDTIDDKVGSSDFNTAIGNLRNAIEALSGFAMVAVDTLPTASADVMNTIYLIPTAGSV